MVIWADPAKIDLRAIHDFIASDSKYYAKKVVQDIMDRTNILDEYPRIGRKAPEIDDENIREIFVYSYRILYEIKAEKVYVIGIIHGRRDFTSTHVYRVKEPPMARRKKMNAEEMEKWLLSQGATPVTEEMKKESWYAEVSKLPPCMTPDKKQPLDRQNDVAKR